MDTNQEIMDMNVEEKKRGRLATWGLDESFPGIVCDEHGSLEKVLREMCKEANLPLKEMPNILKANEKNMAFWMRVRDAGGPGRAVECNTRALYVCNVNLLRIVIACSKEC